MPTALDQRINEWSARLADLRSRAAEIEREANVIEIRLDAFIEARTLMQGETTIPVDVPKASPVANGHQTNGSDVQTGRPSRLSSQWRGLMTFALGRYPKPVTNAEFSEESDRMGSPIGRNNLRSALWTHAKNGLFEKVESGVYRLTEAGANAIGEELPKESEAGSVERIPAPLPASHEPPLPGVIRQASAENVGEAALRPVEPVLGGGT